MDDVLQTLFFHLNGRFFTNNIFSSNHIYLLHNILYIFQRIVNEIDDLNHLEERGHQEILNREVFSDENCINARVISDKPLLVEEGTTNDPSHGFDESSLPSASFTNNNTYPMMIKLIEGSLDGLHHWKSQFDYEPTPDDDISSPIPTIASIATKASREDGTELDMKQLITYETICSTFLLQLLNDGEDDSTSMGRYFANATESAPHIYPDSSSCDSSLSSKDESSSFSACSFSGSSTCKSSSSSNEDISSYSGCSSCTKSFTSNQSQRSFMSVISCGSHNSSLVSKTSAESSSSFTSVGSAKSKHSLMSVSTSSSHEASFMSNQSESSSFASSDHDNDNYFGVDHNSCKEATSTDSSVYSNQSQCTPHDVHSYKDSVIDKLYALGAKDQLIMFLTGSAGAGKTTAVKLAQRFCFEFCRAVSILWNNRTFLFTAYTGSAASCFGGITICKAAFLNKTKATLDEDEIDEWKDVRILVIDEISFMKDSDMIQLDRRLKQCSGDRMKPFGGYSIIFAGDFRQLEPSGAKPHQLLFSRECSQHWENMLNAIIILESKHRFKNDKRYGEMLHRMWAGDLTKKDREWLNERVIGSDLVPHLPDDFPGLDAVFACPKNTERNSISAGNFKRHVLNTHPSVQGLAEPPQHTLIVEANIKSSIGQKNLPNANLIGGAMRQRILTTCGDAKVLTGSKRHVDPALCLYVGAHVLCIIDNENLTNKVPRGNGTLCRVVGIKLKDNAPPCRWKNYYNKKVNTALASDVEWIELEHYPKSKEIIALEEEIDNLRQEKQYRRLYKLQEELHKQRLKHCFRLGPQNFYVTVLASPHCMAPEQEFRCNMTQLPINSNDATTGHKLQGMSKDVVIITSWPKGGLFKNWEYVVLSRVRTRDGLYLFEPIDMNKSFEPSPELALFFGRAKEKERLFLRERNKARKRMTKKER